jgi:hypothetical protein
MEVTHDSTKKEIVCYLVGFPNQDTLHHDPLRPLKCAFLCPIIGSYILPENLSPLVQYYHANHVSSSSFNTLYWQTQAEYNKTTNSTITLEQT